MLTDEQISHMADRFCGWPIPENWNPDGGVSYERFGNKGTPREFKRDTSGTNLFSHEQAKEMIRYMIVGMQSTRKPDDVAEAVETIKKADWTEPLDYVGIPVQILIRAASTPSADRYDEGYKDGKDHYCKIANHNMEGIPVETAPDRLYVDGCGSGTYTATPDRDTIEYVRKDVSTPSAEVRGLKKCIAEAAICLLKPNHGISDTIWMDKGNCTLYEHLVSELDIELTGDIEKDIETLNQPHTGGK
jgi:hypothetical protein